jgi:hypothetical protein
MPSRRIQEGDTVVVRGQALVVADDYLQVVFDDGGALTVTTWVPSRECARIEDIAELKPIRRRGRYLDR